MPSSATSAPISRLPALWLFALVALAIAARAWLLFSTPLVPGMNGAYYLVQARSLLEHGQLGIPDLPLTFWLQAGLAKLIQLGTGLPQDTAIVWAVKLADAALPPLVALPVAWLATQWPHKGERPSTFVSLAPAAAAVLGSQMLRMTGDFQKNALALVWLAALAPAALVFLRHPSLRTMVAPLGLLALLGLTHIGVLGGALVFCAVLAVVALATADRSARRQILLLILLGSGVLGLAGAAAYARYDPARVTRLVEAFTRPTAQHDGRGPGRPPGPPPDFPDDSQPRAETPLSSAPGATALSGQEQAPPPDFSGRPGFAPPSGPGRHRGWYDPRTFFPALVCALTATAAVWLLWKQRRHLPAAEFSVAAAAALTSLVLVAPVHDGQKAERLLLIAVVPTAIAASFVLTRLVLTGWSRLVGIGALALILLDSARALAFGGRAVISDATFTELASLTAQCTEPERTLIVARHGLEWWTAWTLRTHIAQPRAVTAADWTSYTHVLYLQEKGHAGPEDGGDHAPQHPIRHRARPAGQERPGPGFLRGGPGETELPENAVTLHDGTTLTLASAPSAPAKPEQWRAPDRNL